MLEQFIFGLAFFLGVYAIYIGLKAVKDSTDFNSALYYGIHSLIAIIFFCILININFFT